MPSLPTLPPVRAAIHAQPHVHIRPTNAPPAEQTTFDDARLADFSPRARRRLASMLRLRMLELREERLDRVRAVVEHRLPLSSLFDDK